MRANSASGSKSAAKRFSQLNPRSGPAAFSFESKSVYDKKYAELERKKKMLTQTATMSKTPTNAGERSSSPPTPTRSRSPNLTYPAKPKQAEAKKSVIATSPFNMNNNDLFFFEVEDSRSATPVKRSTTRGHAKTIIEPKPKYSTFYHRGSEDSSLEAFIKKAQEFDDPVQGQPKKKQQAELQWFKDPLDPRNSFSSTLFQKHELEAMFNTLVNESLAKSPDNSKDIQKPKASNTSPIESRFESFMEKLEQEKEKSILGPSLEPTLLKTTTDTKISSSFGVGPLLKAFVSVENSFLDQTDTLAHPDPNSTDLSISDLVSRHNEKLLRDRTFRKVMPARSQSPILQRDLDEYSNPLTPDKDQSIMTGVGRKKSDTTIVPRLDLTMKGSGDKNNGETGSFTFKGRNSWLKNMEAQELKSNLVQTNEAETTTIELESKIAALTKQAVILSGIIDDKDAKIRETQKAFEELEEKYLQLQESQTKEHYEQEIAKLTAERDNLRKELNDALNKVLEVEQNAQETSFFKREQESFNGKERSRFLSDFSEEAEIKKLSTETKKPDEYALQKRIKELEKELWMEKEMTEKLQHRLSTASSEITAQTNKMMEDLIREVVMREETLKNDLKKYLSELQNKMKENQTLKLEREALSEKIKEYEQKDVSVKTNMISMQSEFMEMQELFKVREQHLQGQLEAKQKEIENIVKETQLIFQKNRKLEEDFGIYKSKMESGLIKLDKERKDLRALNKEYEEENMYLKKKIAAFEEGKKTGEGQGKGRPADGKDDAKTPGSRRVSNIDPTLNITNISHIQKDNRHNIDGLKKCLTDFNDVLAVLNSFLTSIENSDTPLDKDKVLKDGSMVKSRLKEEISQLENEIVILENIQMDEELSDDGLQLRDKAFTLGMPKTPIVSDAGKEEQQNVMKAANKRTSLRDDQPQSKFTKKNLTVITGDENEQQTKEDKLKKIISEKQALKLREALAVTQQELSQTPVNDYLRRQMLEEKIKNIETELAKLAINQMEKTPPKNVMIQDNTTTTATALNTTATLGGPMEEAKDEPTRNRSSTNINMNTNANPARNPNRRKTLKDLAREMKDEELQKNANSDNQKVADPSAS